MCVCSAEQGNINHPAYGTWTADFMLRRNESRVFLQKDLNDPRVPWIHKRREMMAIGGIILVAKWLAKMRWRSDVGCRLCKRAREQRSASTENLPRRMGSNVWAHQQCLLRWNGDNCHSCPPLHMETSVCQHASCTNTSEKAQFGHT